MSITHHADHTTSGEEIVDLLARLVGFPTESRSPNVDLIAYIGDRAAACGGHIHVVPGAEGRANLLVRFGPDRPGGVVLSGHTDVVPAGTGWATDPYRLIERGASMFGRGTADMKGFVATAIHVLEHTNAEALTAPVHLALSYDEEIGCVGVRGLLDHVGIDGVDPELVIVGEPTGMRVCNAHSGKVSYEINLHGRPAHSFLAGQLPSAVVAAAELALAIDGVQRDPDDGTSTTGTVGHHHVSTNVGMISGGVAINVVAPTAGLTFEIRHSADVDLATLLDPLWLEITRIEQRLSEVGGRIDIAELSRYPALHTDAMHDSVRRFLRLADTGPIGAIDFGSEGGLYAERLGVPVVICGPGHITDAHQPDEFVTLDQLERCRQMITQTIREFCTDKEER